MPTVAETPRFKALKEAPLGSWIVLSGDETTILASGATFEEVSKKSEQLDAAEDFVIIKTPSSWTSFSV